MAYAARVWWDEDALLRYTQAILSIPHTPVAHPNGKSSTRRSISSRPRSSRCVRMCAHVRMCVHACAHVYMRAHVCVCVWHSASSCLWWLCDARVRDCEWNQHAPMPKAIVLTISPSDASCQLACPHHRRRRARQARGVVTFAHLAATSVHSGTRLAAYRTAVRYTSLVVAADAVL